MKKIAIVSDSTCDLSPECGPGTLGVLFIAGEP